ncbi:MAG: alpha/beta fold hydrolase [Patescibacteria group bacterium]|jgi:dipeptidyl aminopeptidase/acylaminoacyl peptidase
MRKTYGVGVFVFIVLGMFYMAYNVFVPQKFLSPIGTVRDKPLTKYTFSALKKRQYLGSEITIEKQVKSTDTFISYIFTFKSDGKKVSGLINLPIIAKQVPIIILIRGFVDKQIYSPGVGTERVGEALASNGYITLAPDYLGFGTSENPSHNSIEERFQTYTTTLNLLASLNRLNDALKPLEKSPQADIVKVGIWGHSNGGHIALSTLALSGKDIPSVLWAPVSKPFPFSILYFTDDIPDHGKALRKAVASFEKDYDIEEYSPTNFFFWIHAPIQIHQGTQDDAVPLSWSDNLYLELKKLGLSVDYFTYTGADHNLMPDGWASAVNRMLVFFQEELNQ